MASERSSKVRAKRYNDHGKPYERRRSIIGMVTDTVKGLFKSSWSGKEESETNTTSVTKGENGGQDFNNTQHKPGNSTHGMDHGLGQSYIQPSSSSVLTGPAKLLPQVAVPSMSHMPAQPISRPEPVNFSSESLPFMQYQQNKQTNLIVNGGDDRSELSECSISTSGCSSMAPQADKKDYHSDILFHSESRIHQMRQEFGGSVTPSKEIEAKAGISFKGESLRKQSDKSFLWTSNSPTSTRRPQPTAKKTPTFNVSIFGTSMSKADKSAVIGTQNESMFYAGKTAFGGSSAKKKKVPTATLR